MQFKMYKGIIIILIGVAGAIKQNCNGTDSLLKCPMALPVLSSPDINFAVTREDLEKNCVGLRSGIKCVDNFTNVCLEKEEQIVFRGIYAGIVEVVNELCTPGEYQEDYLKHAHCVKNVRSEYEPCSTRYEVTLMQINNQENNDRYHVDNMEAINREIRFKSVCCSFQEYLKCSVKIVQDACGDEAASFTRTFLKKMAVNLMKGFCLEYRDKECEAQGGGTQVIPSWILLSGVFALVLRHVRRNLLIPT